MILFHLEINLDLYGNIKKNGVGISQQLNLGKTQKLTVL